MPLNTLVGHAQAQARIGELLSAGRFPHALLLHGPRGIGKRLLAMHLAYRLICGPGQGTEGDMFGPAKPAGPLSYDAASPQAAQLEADSNPDFHILQPEKSKSIVIAQVRELLSVLQRSADGARVVVIDALDNLTDEAANTLLKTLEEPRPDVYFLLVCHQLSAILPTIRSRCRLLRLHPLSLEETRAVLNAQGGDTSLAPLAHGCPGRMLGDGAAAMAKVSEQLSNWLREGGTPPTFTPAATGLVPEALMSLLGAAPPTPDAARRYAQLQTLRAQAADMNLPAGLVAEAALNIMA
jgi:DNA polymerase III delta prime subunit